MPAGATGIARAERFYKPNYAVDFNTEFAAPRSVYIPASIPVVEGQAGKNYAVFTFAAGAEWNACFYLGTGADRSTSSPCNDENGDSYVFDYCVDRATYESKKCGNKPQRASCAQERLSLSPYEYVDVDSIGLSVQSGDSCATTAIELEY